MNVQKLILANLAKNETYTRKVISFLKKDYFTANEPERVVFELIDHYFKKYNALPPPEALAIDVQQRTDLNEALFDKTLTLLGDVIENTEAFPDFQYLVDQTETYCKDKSLHLALSKCIEIMADDKKGLSKSSIPKIMQDALAVSFDTHIGHSYIEDADARYESYHTKTRKLKFGLDSFNDITKGGIESKSLNVVMATSGAGKSLFMCDLAASYLMDGKNVLYISLELAEDKIAARTDANLMDVAMGDLVYLSKDLYDKKIKRIREKTVGNLRIKEFPAQSVGVGHFRHLINDLKTKQGFVPDVVFIDYLNICIPMSLGKGDHNSYDRVKMIAEEIRGLAMELDLPFWSATQSNRQGYGSSSLGLENTSDSMGLVFSVDFMFALVRDETLDQLNQLKVIQLKSRYDDMTRRLVFNIGVNRSKMKLYDLDGVANDDRRDEVPVSEPKPRGIKPGVSSSGFNFAGVK